MNTSPTPAALRFEGISFGYTRKLVLAGVSASVAHGEMVALLGPNGAGKSTLLGLASGALRPSAGRVLLGGDDLRRVSRRLLARQVAVVPQEFSVQFAYSVRQLVELGRAPHLGILGALGAEDHVAVAKALAETSTTALADRVFNELSGGERQRVILALALAQSPRILLLDEPTAHLDIKHQIEILELLRRLNTERGLTVVAALHDLNLAARYFPRLLLFRSGIVADGPPGQVLAGPLLSRVYGTPVHVGILRGEEHLSILPPGYAARQPDPGPITPDQTSPSPALPSVHVLAGGGSGELLMRALADAGVAFSVGPLNVGDSDGALARRLAAQVIEEPPYAPVSAQGLAAARERMTAAETVIICPLPLGPGNIALLEAALESLAAGARVVLLEPAAALANTSAPASAADIPLSALLAAVAERDFSGRGADLYHALVVAGARITSSPADALAALAHESFGRGTELDTPL